MDKKKMFRADLHCHTTCSDGSFTPEELLHHAKDIGLSGLSITDHDTIDAYDLAPKIAKELGLRLGSGIEFSCGFRKSSVHILGYDFSLTAPSIKQFCERHKERRLNRNRKILEKLARLNKPVSEEELEKQFPLVKTMGRPHIAQVMMAKGYVSTLKEAFNLYIGEGKCCYDPGELFSVEETIAVLHQSEGKAFLAHPHLLENAKITREILTLNFDGIECHYAKFSKDKEKKWIKIAQEKKWLISGGSDFHGQIKDYIPLGCSWVDEDMFNKIFQHSI